MPIYEPDLEELVAGGVSQGWLRFATELAGVVEGAEVLFIAVGTPQGDDGAADLSSVGTVARSVGRALAEARTRRERPLVVVNKSTVPVGSGDYVSMQIQEGIDETGGGEENFVVESNPEFLREGSAVYDSLFPDRIVVGPSPARRSTPCGPSTSR